ncbi:MAG: type II toxin-antitoxin system RelE/ParE family toxin [Rhizobiales bacterium]|nr:type II toxin-antitoxin system RelE/ParE family toxin [Hyphomicrobiales bacterium]
MAWKLEFRRNALDQLKSLDRQSAHRIVSYLETRVAVRENPRDLATALQGKQYKGLWRYRVGDYRIIAEIKDDVVTTLVVDVGHRREIYR